MICIGYLYCPRYRDFFSKNVSDRKGEISERDFTIQVIQICAFLYQAKIITVKKEFLPTKIFQRYIGFVLVTDSLIHGRKKNHKKTIHSSFSRFCRSCDRQQAPIKHIVFQYYDMSPTRYTTAYKVSFFSESLILIYSPTIPTQCYIYSFLTTFQILLLYYFSKMLYFTLLFFVSFSF